MLRKPCSSDPTRAPLVPASDENGGGAGDVDSGDGGVCRTRGLAGLGMSDQTAGVTSGVLPYSFSDRGPVRGGKVRTVSNDRVEDFCTTSVNPCNLQILVYTLLWRTTTARRGMDGIEVLRERLGRGAEELVSGRTLKTKAGVAADGRTCCFAFIREESLIPNHAQVRFSFNSCLLVAEST